MNFEVECPKPKDALYRSLHCDQVRDRLHHFKQGIEVREPA